MCNMLKNNKYRHQKNVHCCHFTVFFLTLSIFPKLLQFFTEDFEQLMAAKHL